MTSDSRIAVWRFGLICGFLLLVEGSVRLGWISSFFLASPLQALSALWAQLLHGNALLLTAITFTKSPPPC
jgi:ABC-type nitrate/sulfonate/bicarbonate transport system permease component